MGGWDSFYPPSLPRRVKGGIRARSRRFGESWWAKRWIRALEMLGMGARLARGRSYARAGQVLRLEVEEGRAEALVQGSRREPYRVELLLAKLGKLDRAARAVGSQAGLVARLLAGEMPPEVEETLASAGSSLFPTRAGDLVTSCSCPDWANPCKHVAAVHYILAEELDRDPCLLFKLRGLSRERLLDLAGARRRAPAAEAAPEQVALPVESDAFWSGGELPAIPYEEPPVHEGSAALLQRLGPFPLWQGEIDLGAALLPAYGDGARAGLELLAAAASLTAPGAEREPSQPPPAPSIDGPGAPPPRSPRARRRA